jgi:hypothetical protein
LNRPLLALVNAGRKFPKCAGSNIPSFVMYGDQPVC